MRGKLSLALIGVALAFVASAVPIAALEPHENPDTAPSVFDGVSLLRKYSEALDRVLGRDATGVESLKEQAAVANIPDELRKTVGSFLSSSRSLAQSSTEIESALDTSRAMLAQFRPAEAEKSAGVAAEKLSQAYAELRVMENTSQRTGRWWQADSAAEGSTLRVAYNEVESKLLQIRRLLDLFSEMRGSLNQQSEAIAAVPGLRPTTLTLSVEPATAFVGEPVEFQGTLSAEGKPLAGRKVTLLLSSLPAEVVLTGSDGVYRGRVVLPYRYVAEMTAQTIYYPEGNDIGLFLGSSSPEITIEVLYYQPQLSLQVPGSAYPGRSIVIKGSFDYGKNPVPTARSLNLYWDGKLAAEEAVDTTFTLELAVAAETTLGRHRVTLEVPPQGRYAPVSASAEVEVTKATPVIEVEGPGLVLLPLAQEIRGRAYSSSLGPLRDASVTIILGSWQTSTRTGDDGAFSARLSTGLSLTLVGTQELQVTVTPTEPWHRNGSLSTGLLVINPANIAGLALAMGIPALFGTRQLMRKRRRATLSVMPPAPGLSPALVKRDTPPRSKMPGLEARGGPGEVLLTLYRGVLRMIQTLTAVVLRPSHTLREFAHECAPKLGPLAGYFQEFTLIIERQLYARHQPGEAEAARGKELSQRLTEGAKGEDT